MESTILNSKISSKYPKYTYITSDNIDNAFYLYNKGSGCNFEIMIDIFGLRGIINKTPLTNLARISLIKQILPFGTNVYAGDFPEIEGKHNLKYLFDFIESNLSKPHPIYVIDRQTYVASIKYTCSEWEKYIHDIIGIQLILSDTAYVTQHFVDLMMKSSTSRQESVISKIFTNHNCINQIQRSSSMSVGQYAIITQARHPENGHTILRTGDGFISITDPTVTFTSQLDIEVELINIEIKTK